MILQLFVFLFVVSFILVGIGLWRTEHSELSIIGFFFLFLLSFTILNSQLEIKTGETVTTTYTYDVDNSTLLSDVAVKQYDYEEYGSHMLGFWIIVGSILGVIILLVSLKRTNWRNQE